MSSLSKMSFVLSEAKLLFPVAAFVSRLKGGKKGGRRPTEKVMAVMQIDVADG